MTTASALSSIMPTYYIANDHCYKGVIGISVAICGNILISLALNCQKLAHRRLDREKTLKVRVRELETRRNSSALNESMEEGGSRTTTAQSTQTSLGTNGAVAATEAAPLLQHSNSDPSPRKYGSGPNPGSAHNNVSRAIPPLIQPADQSTRKLVSRLIPFPLHTTSHCASRLTGVREDTVEANESHSADTLLPVGDIYDSPVENGRAGLHNGNEARGTGKEESTIEHGNESDYLKSKLWCPHIYSKSIFIY